MEQAKKFVDPIQLELPNLESEFQQQFAQTEKLQKNWNEWQLELNSVQEKQQTLTDQRHQYQQKMSSLENNLKRNGWHGKQPSQIVSIIKSSLKI